VTITADPEGQGRIVEAIAGHHESREQRHFKERIALWLFISGDAVFLLMELFYWFYLRALNTDGMWRGTACTKANPCTDGLGNPITHEIAKASPWYTFTIAVLAVIAATLVWGVERSAQRQAKRSVIGGGAAIALLVLHRRDIRLHVRVPHGVDPCASEFARVHRSGSVEPGASWAV
jgi:hypothetical protein